MLKISIHAGDFPPNKSFLEIINIIKNVGIKYVEVPYGNGFVTLKNSKRIKQLLADKGLRPCCVDNWLYFLNEKEKSRNREILLESIEIAEDLGTSFIRIGPFGSSRGSLERAIEKYYRNIEPCLEEAKKKKIILLLENEFGDDFTRKVVNCLKIFQEINSPFFRLLYDPCNFYIAGEEPFPYAYNKLKEFISYVHIKDAYILKEWTESEKEPEERKRGEVQYIDSEQNIIWKDGKISKKDFICTSLGRGGINYFGLLKKMKEDNYSGYLSLEPHVKEQIHTQVIKESVKFIINLLRREK